MATDVQEYMYAVMDWWQLFQTVAGMVMDDLVLLLPTQEHIGQEK